MAGDFAAEIDLYDNIDEDFVQECTDLAELFDDVIAPTSGEIAAVVPQTTTATSLTSKPSPSVSSHTGRRVALYIGNITWWTTDVDLTEAINGMGIDDVVEVKFHENRQNGQSKGFCVAVFGSDQSARTVMEKLPKVDIHGQTPVVTTCTKQNLALFEKAAGGDSQTRSRSEDVNSTKTGPSNKGTPLIANPASLGFSLRNNTSLMGQATPTARQLSSSITNSLQQALSSSQFTQLSLGMPTTGGVVPSAATIQGNASSLLPSAFNLSNSLPAALTAANAHVNPNFLQQQASITNTAISNGLSAPIPLMQLGTTNQPGLRTQQQFDHYGRPVIHTYTPSVSGKLLDSEFEDIFQRNKTVSSSAINRAVQDAAGGDYASAIETLVTAISLIKQSKIATDDRCKILINSLQDTLHGIESKSYGSKGSRRRRRRSYSGSGSDGGNGSDGYGGSSSRRYRDRSHRSRSRDRHDRHRRRHSRDRPSVNTGSSSALGVGGAFYATQPNFTLVPGATSLSVSMPLTTSMPGAGSVAGSSSDRCRDTRYRH